MSRANVGAGRLLRVIFLFAVALNASIALAQGRELLILGFGGTYDKVFRTSVIPPFEQKFNAKVTYVGGVGSANLAKVKLQAARPDTDILLTVDQTQVQGEALGLFDRIDRRVVTNISDLHAGAVRPGDLGVSYGLFVAGIEYNSKLFQEKGWPPPSSWYDLFKPQFKGRVIVPGLGSAYGIATLAVLAHLEGGSERNVEPAFKFMKGAAPNVLTFTTAPAELDNLFGQGDAWIAVHSNLRTFPLKDRGMPVDFVVPKEGGVLMTNRAAIVKGAPHGELAQKFVNYLLEPSVQKLIAEALMMGPTNRLAKLDAKTAARVPYGNEQMMKFIDLDWQIIGESLPAWTDRWNREIERR